MPDEGEVLSASQYNRSSYSDMSIHRVGWQIAVFPACGPVASLVGVNRRGTAFAEVVRKNQGHSGDVAGPKEIGIRIRSSRLAFAVTASQDDGKRKASASRSVDSCDLPFSLHTRYYCKKGSSANPKITSFRSATMSTTTSTVTNGVSYKPALLYSLDLRILLNSHVDSSLGGLCRCSNRRDIPHACYRCVDSTAQTRDVQ